jgi:hypothetical protein
MAFNGDEGTVVSLNDASRWTGNFRKAFPSDEIIAHFVGKDKLNMILEQDDCMGIRFYYGIGDDGKKNLIAVGATSDQNDMVDGIILERFLPCKPACSDVNILNS